MVTCVYICLHVDYLVCFQTPILSLDPTIPHILSPISFPNNNSSNFVLGPISLVSIHSECFLSGEVRTGSQWLSITTSIVYTYPKFNISLSTLKLLPSQYYWNQTMATLFCVLVFWLTIKICYLLHRNNSRSLTFLKLCWLDRWSWVKTYLIIIRGIWGFQLGAVQKYREQPLYK